MIPLNRIQEIAAARGGQPAIISKQGTLTWYEFAEQVAGFIDSLSGMTNPHELRTLSVISQNRPDLVVAAAAAATLRLTYTGLDYSLGADVLGRLIDESESDCLIVSSRLLAQKQINALCLAGGRPLIDLDGRLVNGTASLKNGKLSDCHAAHSQVPATRQFRAISFTSGTTGKPKLVLRTVSFDSRRFAYFMTRYGFSAADRHLVTIPLYHAAGSGWARLFLNLGATLVLAPPDDPVAAAELIRSEWITTSAMTPPILAGVLRHALESGGRISPNQLRFVLIGGKHFPVALKQEALHVLGPIIYEYYGTTETGVNTIAEPADLLSHPASVGRPYDGNRILILDENRQPVAPLTAGSVAVSSYMNMDGYINAQMETAVIDGDKYLVTSETAYVDEEDRLFILNRAHQGAEHLNQYALENIIRHVPGVDDVAIVARRNGGTRSVDCAVVLRSSAKWTMAEVENHVRQLLRKERVNVVRFKVLDAIPYSPSGKVRLPDLDASFLPAGSGSGGHRRLSEDPQLARLSKPLTGVLLLTITAVSWGGMFPVAKSALAVLDGFYLTLFRYGLASIILCAILVGAEGAKALSPDRQAAKLLLFGSLGFAGFSILAFIGLAHSKAEHGAIIMALMPLITALLTWGLKGAVPNRITLGCIVTALIGVGLVVTRGNISALSGGALAPDLLILAGAACWVAYTLGPSYTPGWSPLRYTAVSAAFGTVTIVLVTALVTLAGVVELPSLAGVWSVAPEIAYLVLIAAVLAVFTWNKGIAVLGPINGVLFINLVPVTAFAIGMARGHQFGVVEIAGAALTITALIINNLNSRGMFKRLAFAGASAR